MNSIEQNHHKAGKPGRPTQENVPVYAVGIDGKGIAWCDGELSGDPELVMAATLAAYDKTLIRIAPCVPSIEAGWENPLQVIVTLMAYNPGRAQLVIAPEEDAEQFRVFCRDHTADPVDLGNGSKVYYVP